MAEARLGSADLRLTYTRPRLALSAGARDQLQLALEDLVYAILLPFVGLGMLVWFAAILLVGVHGIVKDPSVLRAFSPTYGISFFVRNGWMGFLVLGGVVLVITGGEALYADMGHFGKRPIRVAWLSVAMPALMVNYMGQGAMLLDAMRRGDEAAVRNPFYLTAPHWALYPLIAIATAAAIVASQALISGAFSLTQQAVQPGRAKLSPEKSAGDAL